jgi:hypothetical protein
MNLFPDEDGVLPGFRKPCESVFVLRGVDCTGTFKLLSSTFEGESTTPSAGRRSNNPKTCPSFCGVGPRAFFKGVKRFLTTDGES